MYCNNSPNLIINTIIIINIKKEKIKKLIEINAKYLQKINKNNNKKRTKIIKIIKIMI